MSNEIRTVQCESECDERINKLLKEGWRIRNYIRCPKSESREFLLGKVDNTSPRFTSLMNRPPYSAFPTQR